MKKIIALTAILIGMTARAGDSAPFLLDTTDPLITAPFTYNSSWVGGDSSAEVVISADGTEIMRTTGEGEFSWSPTTVGKHTLTYTTYIDGVVQDEVYETTVYADWKYVVEDGKATIVETTQKSGSVTIPSEIDGYPVVGIESDVYAGCHGLFITVPTGFTNVVSDVLDFGDAIAVCIDYPFATGGDASWRNDEGLLLRSGSITNNLSSWLQMTVPGPGKLTYKWKSSSEYYEDESKGIYEIYDYGYLLVDNEAMGGLSDDEYALEGVAIGGHTDWQEVEFDVTGEGEHTLRWTYVKDEYDDEQMIGEDCIWLDQIKFRPYVTLSFDLGGGVGETPSAIYELHESKITLPADAGFTRDNHVFDGWSNGDQKYAAGEAYEMPRTNVTLRAQWIEKRALSFDLGGGEGVTPDVIKNIPGTVITLPDTAGFDRAKYTFTGWSDGVRTYAAGASYTFGVNDVMFTAQWRANTISMPVISSRDIANGGVLNTASATISISADSGASVYYTLDGSTPNAASVKYTAPFVADGLGCVTIKAIALRDNYFDSEVATFSFTRRPYSAAECLGVNGFSVVTEGDAPWYRVQGDSAHDGESALQSGSIGEGGSSVIEMTVYGKGTISFWWKSSSHDNNRNRKYDYVSFEVDDLGEQAWLGGEKDWVNVTYDVTDEGTHTLKWIYKKNSDGTIAGNDCAWLDEVVWMPAGAIPELGTGASSEMITLVLSGAADAKLAANIKDAAEYAAFRAWTMGLSGISPEQVKASPNAWLSYVLNTDKLIEGEISDGDLKIETFTLGSEDGVFDMKVRVVDASIGPDAALSNLIRAFVVEGTPSLTEDFSVEKVAVAFGEPDDGAATFSISPREIANAFFVRTRLRNQANGDRGNGCEVSFNLNGGGSLPEGMTAKKFVEYASAYGELPTPTREGYRFLGWYTSPEGGELISSDTAMSILATQTLYARWMEADPYCVIDLSAGVNAASYPVTYLSDVPAGGWTDEYKTTKLVLRRIEPGSFKMGGSYDVTITKAFYCGVFEVTQKQYELVTGSKPSKRSGNTLPVEQVSWNMIRGDSATHNWPTVKTVDSNSFVGRLQARTGLNLDIPTEAQWEYACRAGTTTTYYWGDSMDGAYAWYSSNASSTTHVVGTRTPNAWGLYDMSGNAWEWCLDWRGDLVSAENPEGASSGTARVLRGGSWYDNASSLTSSWRSSWISPSTGKENSGFRLVGNLSE